MGVVFGSANLGDFTESQQQQIRDGVANSLTDSLGSGSNSIGGVTLQSGSIIVVVCYRADSNVTMDALQNVANSLNGGSTISLDINGTTLTSTGAAAIETCSADPAVATGAPTAAPTNGPTTSPTASPTAAPTIAQAGSSGAGSGKALGGTGGVVGVSILVVIVIVVVIVVAVKKSSGSKDAPRGSSDSYTYDDEAPPPPLPPQLRTKENDYDTASPDMDENPNSTPERATAKGWQSPKDGSWAYESDLTVPATARTLEYELADVDVDVDGSSTKSSEI